MRKALIGSIISAGVGFAFLALGLTARGAASPAAVVPVLGVDVNPEGNTSTSLGDIDGCVSVEPGSTFDVDIVVTNMTNLLGWESPFQYDKSILEVTGVDVRRFQMANPRSNVIDASESTPDGDGLFFAAAAETGRATDSGSGVLARLTVRAVGTGVSAASLPLMDFDGDGKPDLGPTLASLTFGEVEHIGDVDADDLFDGPTLHAKIAVGTSCTGAPPPPTIPSPTPAPGQTPAPSQTPTPDPTLDPDLDTDADTVPDMRDADDDNDGASDADELAAGTDALDAGSVPETADPSAEGTSDDGPDGADAPSTGGTSGDGGPGGGGDPSGAEGDGSSSDGGGGLSTWLLAAIIGVVIVLSIGLLGVWTAARHRTG